MDMGQSGPFRTDTTLEALAVEPREIDGGVYTHGFEPGRVCRIGKVIRCWVQKPKLVTDEPLVLRDLLFEDLK